jgi:hypothetical protein
MKRSISVSLFVIITTVCLGQRTIDGIFDDYSSKNGYMTFDISGNLLGLNAILNDDNYENDEKSEITSKITRIRVLASEGEAEVDQEFYTTVMGRLERMRYEELMIIKSNGTKAKLMAKAEGGGYSEVILIVGGDENLMVQVKGHFTKKDAKAFSKDIDIKNVINNNR